MEIYDKLSHPVAFAIFIVTLFLPVLIGFITLRRTRNHAGICSRRLAVRQLALSGSFCFDCQSVCLGRCVGFSGQQSNWKG